MNSAMLRPKPSLRCALTNTSQAARNSAMSCSDSMSAITSTFSAPRSARVSWRVIAGSMAVEWNLITRKTFSSEAKASRNASITMPGFLRALVLPTSKARRKTRRSRGMPNMSRPSSAEAWVTSTGRRILCTGTGAIEPMLSISKSLFVQTSSRGAKLVCQSGRKAASSQAQTAML